MGARQHCAVWRRSGQVTLEQFGQSAGARDTAILSLTSPLSAGLFQRAYFREWQPDVE